MTEARRLEKTAEVFSGIVELSKGKSADYASAQDTLLNFKQGANICSVSPFEYWRVLFLKHVQSISNAVVKDAWNPSTTSEPIEGRVFDAINYLLLFLCLLEDTQAMREDREQVIDARARIISSLSQDRLDKVKQLIEDAAKGGDPAQLKQVADYLWNGGDGIGTPVQTAAQGDPGDEHQS